MMTLAHAAAAASWRRRRVDDGSRASAVVGVGRAPAARCVVAPRADVYASTPPRLD